jgi:tyrosyl-tRNA synthetase
MSDFEESLSRFVESVYPSKEKLIDRLASGRKLCIYFGVDPTSSQIHIGHSVPLRLLKHFQEDGHKVILVFGDFTGTIGDPSGRDIQRKPLSKKQIFENCSTYKQQVQKILDFEKNTPEIVYNSTWWEKMNQSNFFEILSHFTLSQLSERDLFQERIKKSQPIAISEFLYPILQGYDSVALNTDIEVGAADQTFNMLVGREMLKIYKKKEKFVLTTPLLEGADGRKMSKSYGNTIDITSKPSGMYGKLMSIKDSLIVKYLTLTTDVPEREIEEISQKMGSGKLNPMEAKKRLAYEIVKNYHGKKEAKLAKSEFERVFQKGENPKPETKNIPSRMSQISVLDVLLTLEMVRSKSEAKRLVDQLGVQINGKKVRSTEEKFDIETGSLAQIGKKKAVSVKVVK